MAETKQYVKSGLVLGAGLLGLLGLWFSTEEWRANRSESPHYRAEGCAVCHAGATGQEPLKASELTLCQSCHAPDSHGVTKVPNAEDRTITVDLGQSHPFGIEPSQKSYPLTLWKYLNDGKVTCQTCHDVHLTNYESRMLRLGSDNNFTPLCHDCHPEY